MDVPAGGATIVFAVAYDGKATGGAFACVNFSESGAPDMGAGCANSATYVHRTAGGAFFASAGTDTYRLTYTHSGAQTASFQNRILNISVIR